MRDVASEDASCSANFDRAQPTCSYLGVEESSANTEKAAGLVYREKLTRIKHRGGPFLTAHSGGRASGCVRVRERAFSQDRFSKVQGLGDFLKRSNSALNLSRRQPNAEFLAGQPSDLAIGGADVGGVDRR